MPHRRVRAARKIAHARRFYEKEALRGGWSFRQLDRHISTQLYERTGLSRNKAAMLSGAGKSQSTDLVTPEEEYRAPYILEFLGLKDEYSESDLEEALILHLEQFLTELGSGFCFVARQRRLRIGMKVPAGPPLLPSKAALPRVDRSQGRQVHSCRRRADAPLLQLRARAPDGGGRESAGGPHPLRGEGCLCGEVRAGGLPNKILAAEYKLALPDEELLAAELDQTRRILESRRATAPD